MQRSVFLRGVIADADSLKNLTSLQQTLRVPGGKALNTLNPRRDFRKLRALTIDPKMLKLPLYVSAKKNAFWKPYLVNEFILEIAVMRRGSICGCMGF